MSALSVSTPTLKFEAVAPDLAVLEKPVEVLCQTAHFPDGGVFDQNQLGKAGLFVYRQVTNGSALQIWDEDGQQWKPDPGATVSDLTPLPMAFMNDSWKGLLVAAGQKDKKQFEKATGQFPQYFFRAWFVGQYKGLSISGLSVSSAPLRFTGALDTLRAGIAVDPDKLPTTATELQIFLRNSGLELIGSVLVKTSGNTAEIQIANWSSPGAILSSLRLLASGEMRLKPAPGQKVFIEGDLEAGEITYQPAGGGAKITLPGLP